MTEKRLASSGDSFVDLTTMQTVDLLNELSDDNTKLHKKVEEQQATIQLLTKRRDRGRELSNSFSAYCNCYEKAIERAFEEKPSPSVEDIYRIYAELEKELENE